MDVESVEIDKLVLDPSNARKHDKKNLEAIKGSLAKFGQQKPIVVGTDNVVIAGNGTLEGARALGWTEIDVVRSELKGADAIAYALTDNRTTDLSTWDDEILGKQLQALYEDDYGIAELGFDPGDYDFDKPSGGATDDDEIPEVPQNVHGVNRGDIWQLGEHRVMCGDSTSKDDVDRLMAGEKADMVFTDPPYGIDLDTDYTKLKNYKMIRQDGRGAASKIGNSYKKIEGDKSEFDPSFILSTFDYCSEVFIWGANYFWKSLDNNRTTGLIVWDKKNNASDNGFGSDFEICWSKSKHKQSIARITWTGMFGTGQEFDNKRSHPSHKPHVLAEWFFDKWGKERNLIVDLFLGSGSTLIACEKTKRKCYGMEIDEHYCSVIIERWQQYTGNTAIKLDLDKSDKKAMTIG
jgi:DNA modification methylase